ncbi:hypothetical protein [uncultured Pseudokineococcus sp.]|uniref:anti-sigma factor family protein n=1 Tax=uncultured Pseudokineococcus sp. TaxID=1642928 RepID=UPI00262375AB|nr:hypothetical protein [uncultured Pseudokineococcus sp.]
MAEQEHEDRRAELLGGAATGDLDAAERAELEALLAEDPSAAAELEDLRAVLAVLPPRGSGWQEPVPPSRRPDPTGADATGARAAVDEPATDDLARRRRSPWAVAAAAAALVLVGAGLGAGLASGGEGAPEGPPGTLGALEQVAVVGEPAGVDADLAVVAHTWGTETVLDVAGLPVGGAYRVVLVGEDGAEAGSGSFLGSEEPVECRLNAALLREDVDRLVVLDAADAVVMTADLPPV